MTKRIARLLLLVGLARCQQAGQDSNLVMAHALLMSPLTTAFSQKGDIVSARVIDPPEWKGWMLEGEVQSIQRNGGNKHASIQFTLHTLHRDNNSSPVSVSLLRLASSRTQKDHDDEGSAVAVGAETEHKSVLHLGLGRDHSSGDKNNTSGPIKVTSDGPNLALAVGTSFELQISKLTSENRLRQ